MRPPAASSHLIPSIPCMCETQLEQSPRFKVPSDESQGKAHFGIGDDAVSRSMLFATAPNMLTTFPGCILLKLQGLLGLSLRLLWVMLYRMGGQDGEPVTWSAPSYFDLMVPGGGAEFSKVELCFIVPDDITLNLFTRGSVGMELPRSRGDPCSDAWRAVYCVVGCAACCAVGCSVCCTVCCRLMCCLLRLPAALPAAMSAALSVAAVCYTA